MCMYYYVLLYKYTVYSCHMLPFVQDIRRSRWRARLLHRASSPLATAPVDSVVSYDGGTPNIQTPARNLYSGLNHMEVSDKLSILGYPYFRKAPVRPICARYRKLGMLIEHLETRTWEMQVPRHLPSGCVSFEAMGVRQVISACWCTIMYTSVSFCADTHTHKKNSVLLNHPIVKYYS